MTIKPSTRTVAPLPPRQGQPKTTWSIRASAALDSEVSGAQQQRVKDKVEQLKSTDGQNYADSSLNYLEDRVIRTNQVFDYRINVLFTRHSKVVLNFRKIPVLPTPPDGDGIRRGPAEVFEFGERESTPPERERARAAAARLNSLSDTENVNASNHGYLITWCIENRRISGLQRRLNSVALKTRLHNGIWPFMKASLMQKWAHCGDRGAMTTVRRSTRVLQELVSDLSRSGYRGQIQCVYFSKGSLVRLPTIPKELVALLPELITRKPLLEPDLPSRKRVYSGVGLNDVAIEEENRQEVVFGYLQKEQGCDGWKLSVTTQPVIRSKQHYMVKQVLSELGRGPARPGGFVMRKSGSLTRRTLDRWISRSLYKYHDLAVRGSPLPKPLVLKELQAETPFTLDPMKYVGF